MSEFLPALAIPENNWRARWLAVNDQNILHRVSKIDWEPENTSGHGITVCNQSGYLSMPGLFTRMDGPRCLECCKALNIPNGNGAPFNQGLKEEK